MSLRGLKFLLTPSHMDIGLISGPLKLFLFSNLAFEATIKNDSVLSFMANLLGW